MAEWNGNWIWCSGEEAPKNFYLYVRKVFDLPGEPRRATARVCADSRYKLYVNGRLIGRGPTRSFPEFQHYDEYDLTDALKKGRNVVAALVHHYGEHTFQYHLGRGAFLFDGEFETAGGSVRVATDGYWKVLPSEAWYRDLPRIDLQLGFQEVYDANKAPRGWTDADFDDSGWENATMIGPVGMPPWKLIPREIPFLPEYQIYPVEVMEVGAADASAVELPEDDPMNISLIQQEEKREKGVTGLFVNADALVRRPGIDDLLQSDAMKPGGKPFASLGTGTGQAATVKPSADGRSSYVVLDFGREVMGYVNLKIRSNSGGLMDIGYSEAVENGIANSHRCGVRYADRVVLKPGEMEYETFDKRAFRYMQIDFRDLKGSVELESVGLRFSTYPVKWRGSFGCSDETLNRIWKTSAYTVQLNMEDAYTDCPWRERAQWMGDARVEALVNYYAFGDFDLARVMLNEIARSQHDDGITDCFAPGDMGPCTPIPSFCLIWIMSIWDYYQFSGDESLVMELYPNVRKAIEWFTTRINDIGLASHLPHWMFIDWADVDIRGAVTSLNCFLVGALRDAANMAKLVGKERDAEGYAQTAGRLVEAINKHLFDDAKGVYIDCHCDGEPSKVISEQTNSLAVLYGVAPREKWHSILDYVHNPENQVVRAGSPYFSFYVLQALWSAGQKSRALDYIRTRWGDMLARGATTCWEQWDDEHSLCHGWSGGPGMDLPAQILGVRPTAPGFKQFEVAPEPLGLDWARCVVPGARGDIEAAWKNADSFTLSVKVPEGCTAAVVLPGNTDPDSIEVRKSSRSISKRPARGDRSVYIVKGAQTAEFSCRIHEPSAKAPKSR